MRIWTLISNVDDILEAYGERVLQAGRGDYEVYVMEYLDIEITSGEKVKISYHGKEIGVPDVFWATVSNTDAFTVENLLLNAGAKSALNMDEVGVARSKIATYQRLAAHGIRVPKTIVFFNHPDKKEIMDRMRFPFVVKPDNGFGGEGVKLIHSEAELDEYLADLNYGIAYIAQEYISTSFGKDIRVVMLEGEYLFSGMRSSNNPDEFRSNVHQGGEMCEYSIDGSTIEYCKKIASLFDLPVIGIDLLIGDNEYVVAEVNAAPGLQSDIMGKVTNAVLRDFI